VDEVLIMHETHFLRAEEGGRRKQNSAWDGAYRLTINGSEKPSVLHKTNMGCVCVWCFAHDCCDLLLCATHPSYKDLPSHDNPSGWLKIWRVRKHTEICFA
jgi:hypothetical protein